jgi:hypothetical protein
VGLDGVDVSKDVIQPTPTLLSDKSKHHTQEAHRNWIFPVVLLAVQELSMPSIHPFIHHETHPEPIGISHHHRHPQAVSRRENAWTRDPFNKHENTGK